MQAIQHAVPVDPEAEDVPSPFFARLDDEGKAELAVSDAYDAHLQVRDADVKVLCEVRVPHDTDVAHEEGT